MELTCELVQGVGLAAPQIGIGIAAVLVLTSDGWLRAINPTIDARSGKEILSREGCLSLPGEDYLNKRWTGLKVSYRDLGGKLRFRESRGFEAIIWQHEIAHCAGKLISEGDKFEAPKEIIKP